MKERKEVFLTDGIILDSKYRRNEGNKITIIRISQQYLLLVRSIDEC